MKRFAVTVALLAAIAAGAASQSADAQAKRRPRLAIMDFDYATVQTTSAAIFGTNVDIGKGIRDLLVNDLVKDGSYSIIERAAMDKILAEQNFSNSNRADPMSAAKIGKLLGIDAMVIGSITEFGNETQKKNFGGGGGNWGGFGVGGIGHSKSNANVRISARIVNIDTAEILGVADGFGQSSRSSTSLLGGGGNWHGWGGGNADFGSSDFQNTIIGEATKKAVDALMTDMISDAPKITTRQVTVDGLVAAVDGGQIVLNVGKKGGVNVGDQLEVVRVTKEIKDPATGQVIRRLTSSVGIVKATDVDDGSAVCVPVSGTGFQTGDRVKALGQ